MIESFNYISHPARVRFGQGSLSMIAEEAERLGCDRLLLISTGSQLEACQAVRAAAGELIVAAFPYARMHTPIETTEEAMQLVTASRADGLVALGGGSAIGLAKAIAVRTDLPQIVLPTTYAGSEMTPILGETSGNQKTTQSNPRILPETVIYDVDLTFQLPVPVSVTSGFNAMAHAVEALYAREKNPVTAMIAERAVITMIKALPKIARNPRDIAARSDALMAAWLSGICLAGAGMALHHKLCHTLGGTFALPHAETHTIVLPHALAYNQRAAGTALEPLLSYLGPEPGDLLQELARNLGAPTALRDLGMPESAIDEAANIAMAAPYWNPRPLDHAEIRELIRRAWSGAAPKVG